MGVKYLWIDSLCIVQDDPRDWSTEAGRMAAVYSQAACTIAASSSCDSEGGLFLERSAEQYNPVDIEVRGNVLPQVFTKTKLHEQPAYIYRCDMQHLRTQAIERAPLNRRDWVNQEHLLSSRLMHFTDSQFFWECHEAFTSENYPGGLPDWAHSYWFDDILGFKTALYEAKIDRADNLGNTNETPADVALVSSQPAKDELYFEWCNLRIRYTTCDLTEDRDKLVAIKGIADAVGEVLEDELVAGLWKSRLSLDLCWFKRWAPGKWEIKPEPIGWRAPTWSWARSNATVWVSTANKFHRRHGCMYSWINIVAVDVDAAPSGELRSASLQIQCRLLSVTLHFPDHHAGESNLYKEQSVTIVFENTGFELRIDTKDPTRTYADVDIKLDLGRHSNVQHAKLAILQYYDHDSDEIKAVMDKQSDDRSRIHETCLEGLILASCSERNDTFVRVGLFTVWHDEHVKKFVAEYEEEERRVITLV